MSYNQSIVKNLLKSTVESERLKLLSELKLVHSAGRIACHSMSQLLSNKSSLKGAWSGLRDQFKKFTPHEISSERLKLQTSDFVHGLVTRSTNLQMTNSPLNGLGQGHVTHSRISHP